ncbi:melanocortin-2 receptor accessory protein 2 [Callorhinchus milii]|uniref:melanocortin-2 receptor accessory protein 2 n=1 Tax=Callorhinchus milii TaxID=7868 RepID=UPI0004572804|nr:melanocortin-2 receptor accessory protein 2 [Callorhinchus milii]|eukprot:gi/632979716/ref/XP_007906624.1/ PREDICTED: melanocortin-2 receptor accessory protein 2 [Callorhinchus milii]
MSENNPVVNKTTHHPGFNNDYTWGYEYYDYGPVSFEGLKAHRYSIVIGFWVGLVVFVIFMFFVLTLLTKTGAPHQENVDLPAKQHRMNGFSVGYPMLQKPDKAFVHRVSEESRSLFHCYVNEVGHFERQQSGSRISGPKNEDLVTHEKEGESDILVEPWNCLAKFDIPNFVNSDQSSSLAEDDLLMCDQPIVLENKPISAHNIHQNSD